MAKSDVYRGQYGPTPLQALPRLLLLAKRAESLWHGWFVRHLIRSQRHFRVLDRDEQRVRDLAVQQASFPARGLNRCPREYALKRASVAPYSRDALTLSFEGPGGRSFESAERLSWLPICEQLETAQVPYAAVSTAGIRLYVIYGRYGGEPIDHSFWATRQAVVRERDGVLSELREVIGRGPGLATLMALALEGRAPANPRDMDQ